MKLIFILSRSVVLAAVCALLAGCWDRKELDDLALVMAAGVDLTEDGETELSLQIALPTGIPGTLQSSGKGQKPTMTISAKGPFSFELIGQLQQQVSRRIFFGHRGIVIIGENYARQGIDQILDTLLRYPESRSNSYVLTSQGASAKEILSAPYRLEVIPAIGMKSMQMSDFSLSLRVDKFLDAISSRGSMPVMGAIRLLKDSGGSASFQIDQAAVYRDNKLAGYMSGKNLKAFKMLRGQGKRMTVAARIEPKGKLTNGAVTIELLKTRKKMRVYVSGGSPRAEVDFQTTARVIANDSTLDISKIPNMVRVERVMANEIQDMIEGMISQTQDEFKSDVLGFGTVLHIQHPYAWKKLKANWFNQYPDVPIKVKAHVRIERIGKTQLPGQMPA